MNTFLHTIENDPKESWKKRLEPAKRFKKIDLARGYGKKMINDRWKKVMGSNRKYKEYLKRKPRDPYLNQPDMHRFYSKNPMQEIMDRRTYQRSEVFRDNVENFIGTIKIPVGIAGPILVNGLHASGDYYVPMATTETNLVATVSRGISAINQSGGATAAVIMEGVNRDPIFSFNNLIEVFQFMRWTTKNFDKYAELASKMTRFGKLVDIKYLIDGRDVHMKCVYTAGDASGQNMVTICTERILEYIKEACPIQPRLSMIEGGLSGDKKATSSVLSYVRGKRVIAEVTLKRDVAQAVFHTSCEMMDVLSRLSTQSYFWNGTIGINQHFSKTITAMSVALGQDPACTSESHVGCGRAELTKEGNLYFCITLPNLLVGSVGGGTKLPSQKACLEIMGLFGSGHANALAEVFASVCIAGELALSAAILTGDFEKNHKMGRANGDPIDLRKDTLDEAFLKAEGLLARLSEVPPKRVILEIYGLYKQATCGDVTKKPDVFSSVLVREKYNAWRKKKGMDVKTAKKLYIDLLLKLSREDKKRSNQPQGGGQAGGRRKKKK